MPRKNDVIPTSGIMEDNSDLGAIAKAEADPTVLINTGSPLNRRSNPESKSPELCTDSQEIEGGGKESINRRRANGHQLQHMATRPKRAIQRV
jgi:hypothetical protein